MAYPKLYKIVHTLQVDQGNSYDIVEKCTYNLHMTAVADFNFIGMVLEYLASCSLSSLPYIVFPSQWVPAHQDPPRMGLHLHLPDASTLSSETQLALPCNSVVKLQP